MGRGRNRKPRNSGTFRLCPRPGAADAADRVFVRVDDNPYSVPGFADEEAPSSSTSAVGGDGGEPAASADDDRAPLPDHVRREILELGLPDDGYDYLAHLRELRPSLSSTGGGGSSAVFLPSRRPARSGPRVDVKVRPQTAMPSGRGRLGDSGGGGGWGLLGERSEAFRAAKIPRPLPPKCGKPTAAASVSASGDPPPGAAKNSKAPPPPPWCVYLIASSRIPRTYVGVTTDFPRR